MRPILRHAAIISSVSALLITPAAVAASKQDPDPARLVINRDFPDPDIFQEDGTYYAFATNSHGVNVQVATADNPEGPWRAEADALPKTPDWVGRDARGRKNIWAPDVSALNDGRYLLYFAGFNPKIQRECVGAAISDTPTGPFTATSQQPLICDPAKGEVIDASTFIDDDGSRYLLYKDVRGSSGAPATLQIRPVADDGVTPTGPDVELLRADRPEEAGVIEAPTMVRRPEGYVLFYSGNAFNKGAYFVNYATSDSPEGPFTKAPGAFLSKETTGGNPIDPGGQDVLSDRLVFHGDLARPGGPRGMYVSDLSWDGLKPVFGPGDRAVN